MPSRRPAPTMLFTAIAATVAILPWAAGPGTGHREQPVRTGDAQLTQQPLVGLGGGVTIREIRQHTPFSMVALTGGDLTDTSARIRARHGDGSWGPWYSTETLLSSSGHGSHGTDPVFVGKTTTVQIAVHRPPGAPQTTSPKHTPDPGLGYIPVTAEQPLAQNISAILISPPQAPADTQWTPPTAVIAAGQAPNIIARAQWGADEAVHCGNRPFDQPIRAAVVHHTAESNDYQPQDSAAIVQSIYAYHTQILGWCDIAYNALVDKYGQVFEGRAGALTGPVQGDHTGGFNRDSWGVAMIGNFDDVAPTPMQLQTLGRLLGWRLGLDHIDPKAMVALPSAGGENTNFPLNTMAML
ncbi:MAG: N-acetylmuramoyl-L-alanine amidase, partial [Mycobacterium sp.]